jgi:hypothetical protein
MAKLTAWSGLFAGEKAAFPIYLATKKCSSHFGAAVIKVRQLQGPPGA